MPECTPDMTVCRCDCHDSADVKHTMSCCVTCPDCEQCIKDGLMAQHRRQSHPSLDDTQELPEVTHESPKPPP